MTQSGRSAARSALIGIAFTLITIVLAVIIVVGDLPIIARVALGIVAGLALVCAGVAIGYALAVIRMRDEDDEG
ncbi:hypothetical protein [Paramicrobacterium chengjingii]|uniref:CTP synthetase n=1 Tax=Paramicrobacterium chengjingii TaxID=2769067 RepID=A0ABX6YIR3_9MICO|nr:hypothetical protein [Microbacterium chengjingii]QPZ38646.1 hypothetical protein HCR76_00595 [Microbacterium chengjingii]